jgi:hypothetical protein
MDQCERSAQADGWIQVLKDLWIHVFPWETGIERPMYIVGTARDVCLLQGLETGDPL